MAQRRTRRSFTREFKAQAVKRLLEGGRGLSEVATELGLSTGQLSTWRSEQLAAGSAEALAQSKAEEAETHPCAAPPSIRPCKCNPRTRTRWRGRGGVR